MRVKMKNFDKLQLLKQIQEKEKRGWECVCKIKRQVMYTHQQETPVWFVIMERVSDGD